MANGKKQSKVEWTAKAKKHPELQSCRQQAKHARPFSESLQPLKRENSRQLWFPADRGDSILRGVWEGEMNKIQ